MNVNGDLAYSAQNNSIYFLGFKPNENFTNRALYSLDLSRPLPTKVMDGMNLSRIKISPVGSLLYLNKSDSMFVYDVLTMELLYDFNSVEGSMFYFDISPIDPHVIVVRADGMVMYKNGVALVKSF
jgi:hypothetical protein